MASGWYTEGKRSLLQDGATAAARCQPVASNYFFDQSTSSMVDIDPFILGDYKFSTPTWVLTGDILELDYFGVIEWYEGELPQTGSLGGFVFYDNTTNNAPFFYIELDEAIQLNGQPLTVTFSGAYQARI